MAGFQDHVSDAGRCVGLNPLSHSARLDYLLVNQPPSERSTKTARTDDTSKECVNRVRIASHGSRGKTVPYPEVVLLA